MNRFNLAPQACLDDQRLMRRASTWARLCVAYGIIVTAGWAVVVAATPPMVDRIEGQLTEARQRVQDADRQSSVLRRKLSEETLHLRRIEQIRRIPDWSALFVLVGSEIGGKIYLEEFGLGLVGSGAAAPTPEASRSFVLSVTGVTREQAAITNFVLALERSGLFERVDLLQQRRRQIGDIELIVFDVECLLVDGEGSRP